ncbi:MAG: IS3 family transposase [Streptococcus anginosus]
MLTAHSSQLTVATYIVYYNNKRIKTKLKGLSPVQYRTKSFH